MRKLSNTLIFVAISQYFILLAMLFLLYFGGGQELDSRTEYICPWEGEHLRQDEIMKTFF